MKVPYFFCTLFMLLVSGICLSTVAYASVGNSGIECSQYSKLLSGYMLTSTDTTDTVIIVSIETKIYRTRPCITVNVLTPNEYTLRPTTVSHLQNLLEWLCLHKKTAHHSSNRQHSALTGLKLDEERSVHRTRGFLGTTSRYAHIATVRLASDLVTKTTIALAQNSALSGAIINLFMAQT